MKTQILYAPSFKLTTLQGGGVPVVLYSDHCAALDERDQLRLAAVRRCDNLLKQLERMALLLEEKHVPLSRW